MWGPPVIGWFINPMNTIVIGTINHIVIGVMFTNLAIVNGGLTRGTYCCGVVLQLRSRERSHSSRCETFGVTLQGAPLGVESPGHAQGHRQGLGTARRLHDLPWGCGQGRHLGEAVGSLPEVPDPKKCGVVVSKLPGMPWDDGDSEPLVVLLMWWGWLPGSLGSLPSAGVEGQGQGRRPVAEGRGRTSWNQLEPWTRPSVKPSGLSQDVHWPDEAIACHCRNSKRAGESSWNHVKNAQAYVCLYESYGKNPIFSEPW